MAKTIEVLLTENVDGTGIVGDVVRVKIGFARNYLLPRGLATEPDTEVLKQLADKRAEAEKTLAAQRADRESMIGKLEGLEITLERSCNETGVLYGSVTQEDIASALTSLGYPCKAREVRLPHAIKRIDSYDVLIKLDSDLETSVRVWVAADKSVQLDDDRDEMEFDNEGNLIEKPRREPNAEDAPAAETASVESAAPGSQD